MKRVVAFRKFEKSQLLRQSGETGSEGEYYHLLRNLLKRTWLATPGTHNCPVPRFSAGLPEARQHYISQVKIAHCTSASQATGFLGQDSHSPTPATSVL
uniref:Retrotransposon gag domain-containing protein n=1 Tax=Setaria digitata TaxID=48799 RepID=A0A915PT71_9BILA